MISLIGGRNGPLIKGLPVSSESSEELHQAEFQVINEELYLSQNVEPEIVQNTPLAVEIESIQSSTSTQNLVNFPQPTSRADIKVEMVVLLHMCRPIEFVPSNLRLTVQSKFLQSNHIFYRPINFLIVQTIYL